MSLNIAKEKQGDADAKHPRVITMYLASSPRDTRITYTKVNSILYVYLLGSLTDGILLETFTLCTFRFESNDEHAMEEVMHKEAPTPFAREAWKRRKNLKGSQPTTSRKIEQSEPMSDVQILSGPCRMILT